MWMWMWLRTLALQAGAVAVLAGLGERGLAAYFVAAWVFNAVAANAAHVRPFTLNSVDFALAWKSSGTLLIAAVVECVVAWAGRDAVAAGGWAMLPVLAVQLLIGGVLLHVLTPYSGGEGTGGALVLQQGDVTPPVWIQFHPWAWTFAVVINIGGVAVHMEAALRHAPGVVLHPAYVVGILLVSVWLVRKTVAQSKGQWARRDASWKAQPRTTPTWRLLSPHSPTWSTYIPMSDGTRLAADVFLPCGHKEVEPRRDVARPCIVHFTPYNRNWRVRKNQLALGLLSKYGVDRTERLFNARSLRYLNAFVPRGFAFVTVDLRGTGASFGHRDCDLLPRELQDMVEVTRWTREQSWCDGFLASGGISYDGMAAMSLAAALPADEALNAIFPLFSPTDIYRDLCFPGGCPCTGFADSYGEFRHAAENDHAPSSARIPMSTDKRLLYSWISGKGDSLSPGQRWWLAPLVQGGGSGAAPVGTKGAERSSAIAEHALNWDHTEALRSKRFRDDVMAVCDGQEVTIAGVDPDLAALRQRRTAVYAFSGWFDSGSARTVQRLFDALSSPSAGKSAGMSPRVRVTLGPWNHGLRAACDVYTNNLTGRTVPQYDMYGELADWLCAEHRGRDAAGATGGDSADDDAPVHFYMMGAMGVEGRGWQAATAWPPTNVEEVGMILCAGRRLLTDAPRETATAAAATATASEIFDVDSTATTGVASRWNLVQHILMQPVDYGNRRSVSGVMSFTSEPLAEPLAIVGAPQALLHLALGDGAEDGCVFVYLEDVPPSNAMLPVSYVTEGQMRMGFAASAMATDSRESEFNQADLQAFTEGIVPVTMQQVAYTFAAQHCVRLTLAGGDAQNFLPLDGSAQRWRIGIDGPSTLVLPQWHGGC